MAGEALEAARKHLWITYFNAQFAAQGRDVPPPDMLTALRDVEAAAVEAEVRALREALRAARHVMERHYDSEGLSWPCSRADLPEPKDYLALVDRALAPEPPEGAHA